LGITLGTLGFLTSVLPHELDNFLKNFMNDNSVDMDRVILSEFEAGHMMYNHQTSFDRFLNEVLDFIKTDK
jgi:NAD kinase